MLSILFILIGASCDAMVDTLSHHWYMFRWKGKVNEQWWDPTLSWMNKNDLKWYQPLQLSDAFHFFKTIRIICWMLAVVYYHPMMNMPLDFLLIGFLRNEMFSLCYDKLYVKKKI